MSSVEYYVSFTFLLLAFVWLGLVSWLMIYGADHASQGKIKSSIICFVLAILVIAAGVFGWSHISRQPDWAFLKTPVCEKCNSTLEHDAQFCDHCGTSVDTEQKCCECNHSYDMGDQFCSNCGTKINREE